jgi:hypothetical protein
MLLTWAFVFSVQADVVQEPGCICTLCVEVHPQRTFCNDTTRGLRCSCAQK